MYTVFLIKPICDSALKQDNNAIVRNMNAYLTNHSSSPFGANIIATPCEQVILLPTPRATLIKCNNEVVLFGPHSSIKIVKKADWIVSVRPEAIKLLFGKVRDFIETAWHPQVLSALGLFNSCSTKRELLELLKDGRDSVKKVWDEEQFVYWWTNGMVTNAIDRSLQRACTRYGGQSPQQIRLQYKLGLSLIDYIHGGDIYKECFSDQSHFIRSCKRRTSQTPREIRNLSGLFYFYQEEEI